MANRGRQTNFQLQQEEANERAQRNQAKFAKKDRKKKYQEEKRKRENLKQAIRDRVYGVCYFISD
jgi:hypothetical protein